MNVAMILAGGVGKRLGAAVPKQFIKILDKPILIYTLETFQNDNQIDTIQVVCIPEYQKQLWDWVEEYARRTTSSSSTLASEHLSAKKR